MDGLGQMVKDGTLGQLTVVNIATKPQPAQELGVRSVPWFRIGELELLGLHSESELREWAAIAADGAGLANYFRRQLTSGGRATVVSMLHRHPERAAALVSLLADGESGIDARLGVMACIEELPVLDSTIEPLAAMLESGDSRIRTDACEALGHVRSEKAASYLRQCLEDEHTDVREAAQEGLERIPGHFKERG